MLRRDSPEILTRLNIGLNEFKRREPSSRCRDCSLRHVDSEISLNISEQVARKYPLPTAKIDHRSQGVVTPHVGYGALRKRNVLADIKRILMPCIESVRGTLAIQVFEPANQRS